MDLRGIPRRRRQADIEPGIARTGISKPLELVPVITSRLRARSRILKKLLFRAPGRDRAREGRRARRHRGLVRRRGPHRPEEQDHPPLGQARHASERADGPTNRLGLYLRRDLPQTRERGAALIMPRCNTEAMNLHLAEIATQIAPGAHAALLVDQAGWHLSGRRVMPPNSTLIPVAGEMSGAQSAGKPLAVSARQLALKPNLQILRRRRQPLLRGLEQARRSTLADHVHRPSQLGPWVLINESWYYRHNYVLRSHLFRELLSELFDQRFNPQS